MQIRFIKLPGHRVFNYSPRYYNEQKEKFDERIQKAKRELGIKEEGEEFKPLIKGQMRSYFKNNVKEKRQSNLRLAVILIVLILIAYWLFYSSLS
ncbi:hypothetical protein ACFLTE_07960 [Bacteroidota bacterium]